MPKSLEANPFMAGMVKNAKQQIRRWEDECNRKEPIRNAGWHLDQCRRELKELLAELRSEGYDV